ncbi:hypothetical protein BDZ89DRAFT_3762 [Hymenopellis radicata]|nr:hypothetical protein BDZ89DRAFT_3762 [Hymenopellis radicata]
MNMTTSKPLPAGYSFVDVPPDLETYLDLRRSSGLSPKSPAQGTGALTGSWAFCTVVYTPPRADLGSTSESQVVGMTRVFGDGGWYFVVADVVVLPAHRRQGLAEGLLRRLLAKIESDAPPGALITLSADEMGRELYRKCGFVETAPKNIGMWIRPYE